MNYVYHGIYMREPSGVEGFDRLWVFIAPDNCSLVLKLPNTYTEQEVQAFVESLPDPNNPDPEPSPPEV